MEDPKQFDSRISADADVQATSKATAQDEEPMLFCPICFERLDARKCKLICRRCGYYMSCADYI